MADVSGFCPLSTYTLRPHTLRHRAMPCFDLHLTRTKCMIFCHCFLFCPSAFSSFFTSLYIALLCYYFYCTPVLYVSWLYGAMRLSWIILNKWTVISKVYQRVALSSFDWCTCQGTHYSLLTGAHEMGPYAFVSKHINVEIHRYLVACLHVWLSWHSQCFTCMNMLMNLCCTDVSRSKAWVVHSRREDLLKKDADYLRKNCHLCAAHFEPSQFMNTKARNKLIWNALPSLFSIPNPPALVQSQRRILVRTEVEKPKATPSSRTTDQQQRQHDHTYFGIYKSLDYLFI